MRYGAWGWRSQRDCQPSAVPVLPLAGFQRWEIELVPGRAAKLEPPCWGMLWSAPRDQACQAAAARLCAKRCFSSGWLWC